jgi:hypothetical protein
MFYCISECYQRPTLPGAGWWQYIGVKNKIESTIPPTPHPRYVRDVAGEDWCSWNVI